MGKVAIVYWSGTGNTEAMANMLADGARAAGAAVDMFTPNEFSAGQVADYAAIALGCPSMGAEQLEETEFEPMYNDIKGSLTGKRVALFGSYGWGDGEWMRNFKADVESAGAFIINDFVISQDAPDAAAEEALKELGAAMAKC